jgi:hypothetical protein
MSDKIWQTLTKLDKSWQFEQILPNSRKILTMLDKFSTNSAKFQSSRLKKFVILITFQRIINMVMNDMDKSWMISNYEQSSYFSNIFKTKIFQTRTWKVLHNGFKGILTNSQKFWHFRRKSVNAQKILRMLKNVCVTNSDKFGILVKPLSIINRVWILRTN